MNEALTLGNAWPDAPYKGLGYYTESDALLFAGRDEDTRICAATLAESRARVVLLHGSTGCGKSSFLRAGLVPYLENKCAGFAFARTAPDPPSQTLFVRSTSEPLAALALGLFRFATNRVPVDTPDGPKTIDLRSSLPEGGAVDAVEFLRDFANDPDVLLNVLERLSRLLSETLVLIIDQGEEVLTVDKTRQGDEWRHRYFEFLAEFCRRQFDVKLLISLRTEYLGRFLATARRHIRGPGVAEFFLDDLDEAQIRDAILRPTSAEPVGSHGAPVDKYQFSFDDGVVSEIIAQVRQASGGKLIALQIVCTALYERASTTRTRRIDVETLRSVGGVEGSIERFVDETLFECGRLANLAPVICEQEANRWKEVLHGLARPQPDGTVTTDIRETSALRRELATSRLPFDSTAEHLIKTLLLRPVSVVDVKNGTVVPCFGLGHDALGLVLRNWKTRHGRPSAPVHSGSDYLDDELSATENDVALCLSGDGYRSMLFNLGAIWRLNELAMLPRLARVSGVSGGAIVGAFLGYRWRELVFANGVAENFEHTIATPLRRLAAQTITRPGTVHTLFGLGKSGGQKLAEALDQHLYVGATLRELSDEPVIVLTATNLQCGSLFRFSKSYLADPQLGRISTPDVPLATAVAASSAVLPMSPVVLALKDSDWKRMPGTGPSDPRYRERVYLTDGGIYDNLGLEVAWKRHRTILVSDGAAGSASTPEPATDLAGQIVRLVGVMDQSLRAVRHRQVTDAFEAGHKQGVYWTVRDPVDSNVAASLNLNPIRQELAEMPGEFVRLTEESQECLINWGYAACDAAIDKNPRALGSIHRPARLPYSRGVGSVENRRDNP